MKIDESPGQHHGRLEVDVSMGDIFCCTVPAVGAVFGSGVHAMCQRLQYRPFAGSRLRAEQQISSDSRPTQPLSYRTSYSLVTTRTTAIPVCPAHPSTPTFPSGGKADHGGAIAAELSSTLVIPRDPRLNKQLNPARNLHHYPRGLTLGFLSVTNSMT